jgi:multidrug resistance efflux pump
MQAKGNKLKSILLSLAIVISLVAGYFIGDYRGKSAREILEKDIAMGKAIEKQRNAEITSLKTELNNIKKNYDRDIKTIREDYEQRSADWERTKSGLSTTIQKQENELNKANMRITQLKGDIAKLPLGKRAELEREIAQLEKQRNQLQRQIEGNRCLKIQVPQSAIDSLSSTQKESKQ